MDFSGKVVWITGGAMGIGRCIGEQFARLGAGIAFLDRDKQAGERTAARLRALGAPVLFVAGDAAEQQTLAQFVTAAADAFGRVDYLINNACMSQGGIRSGCSYEQFNYVLHVGVSAPYELARLCLPYFGERAAIVNITSTRAQMSQPDTESYTAAKGGISALTHALAVSLGPKVRVNAIAPGWIDTSAYHEGAGQPQYRKADLAQHPSGRVGRCEDVARAALFLCEENNDFITGQTITVDGGMTRLMIYDGDEGWRLETEPLD